MTPAAHEPAPLPEDWQTFDLAGCWSTLLEHSRERHQRGEKLHPGWLPEREGESEGVGE